MKYPTIRYVFDRRNICNNTRDFVSKNGSEFLRSDMEKRGYIEIEISYNARRKWISTGISVRPDQWDELRMVVNHPKAMDLNIRLQAVRKPVDDYVRNQMLRELPFTFEGLAAWLERKSNKGSFIAFVENRIEEQTDIKEATKKAHRKLVSALKRFKKIVTFDSLTRSSILEYDSWLHSQPYTQPTIHSYHKLLRRYVNEALSRDLIQNDPYSGIRIEKGKSKERRYLTEEEISKIRSCQGLIPTLERVRDVFVFQCFTGLSYADVAKFDFSKVVHRGNRYVLHDQRQKNQEDYYIVLLTPALEILKKYDFKLPVISNQQYNLRLKLVADAAKLNRSLSSHMARHSFLTMALNHGIPIETVSKMAGHTNIKTTQIYAKLLNKAVESAFDILERELK